MSSRLTEQMKGQQAQTTTASPVRSLLQRKCDCGQHTLAGGNCEGCEKKRLQRSALNHDAPEQAPQIVQDVLSSPGQSLDATTRSLMETRFSHDFSRVQTHSLSPQMACAGLTVGPANDHFEQEADRVAERIGQATVPVENQSLTRTGYDFSHVRVHTGAQAAESARAVNAQAYTVGHNVVFGAGRYAPGTHEGQRLLAHELTHVLQQSTHVNRKLIQRCPDAATDTVYDQKAAEIKAHAEYGKLPVVSTPDTPGTKATADKIITDAKPKSNCIFYIDKLRLLFDTPVAPPAVTSTKTQAATATAAAAETKRMADPKAKATEKLEESSASAAGHVWVAKKGKFGGGTYFVDQRDPNNIFVKAKIFLEKKGTGTDKDIDSIKGMEDAIEKAASTQGYIVDIEFVTVADAETFKVGVDPSKWEVATNWSGGEPVGFAHELHHMFAFELDRYDYIASHAQNTDMAISNRVHWFGQELTKPAGYNNPTSIMDNSPHPNDDDACTVAGLNIATCVASRGKARKAFTDIFTAYPTYDERILNAITKYQKKDPDLLMPVLRELFRRILGLPEVKKQITKRLNGKTDALGKVFQQLTADQQAELLAIIPP